jgi:hypothetical protein
MSENFRVENKQNVHMRGRKTTFQLFRRQGDAFVFQGIYSAFGWDAKDDTCIRAALEQAEEDSNN